MTAARVCVADHMPGEAAQDTYVPVVIIGGGACGLTAALMLRDAGIDCAVLERDGALTGSTALSSGFIPAPGTHAQRAAGIDDSPERFAADITAKAKGRAAPHLVRAYAEAIGPALDALAQRHGLQWELLDGFLYPGHGVRRMHAVPERTGLALMTQLERAARISGAMIVTEAIAVELWVSTAGNITGVGYCRPDGSIERVRCDHLLLACNGFGGNAEMVQELLPDMKDAIFAGHAGNDGSAIAWGRELNARMADLGGYQGHGSWAVPQGALVSWALMMDGGVQINAHGLRFHDETHGYSEASVNVLAQPGSIAWNVFDQQTLALARGFPDFRDAEAAGALRSCADVADLATLIGCGEGTLQQTLASVSPGLPDLHGRTFARTLCAPFFAIKVTGALFHTQGGLDIDVSCRVLRVDGSAFDNLFAAGGAARGVSGDAVWGYLSGNGLLSAVAGGFIAARSIISSQAKDL